MKNIVLNWKVIVVLIALIILLALFIKYEHKLVFVKYLPETINKSIHYIVNDYKVTIPLHKLAFIENYDISLKPYVKYFTFLNNKKINEFYIKSKLYAETNYKVQNVDGICFYFDELNKTYVQIPYEYNIEEKDIFFRQVRFKLLDKETIEKCQIPYLCP